MIDVRNDRHQRRNVLSVLFAPLVAVTAGSLLLAGLSLAYLARHDVGAFSSLASVITLFFEILAHCFRWVGIFFVPFGIVMVILFPMLDCSRLSR